MKPSLAILGFFYFQNTFITFILLFGQSYWWAPDYQPINIEQLGTLLMGDYSLLKLLCTKRCVCFYLELYHISEK